jgi:hypothetical protein
MIRDGSRTDLFEVMKTCFTDLEQQLVASQQEGSPNHAPLMPKSFQS